MVALSTADMISNDSSDIETLFTLSSLSPEVKNPYPSDPAHRYMTMPFFFIKRHLFGLVCLANVGVDNAETFAYLTRHRCFQYKEESGPWKFYKRI